ncbi:U3 small nucleolar RNA-associated protein 6-domain-containing protein [Amylostereum chailletii]|nr:U3 small nucleolar RNA-associated protein 6-domain-containing protein [Amylostereum chailletii]
MERVQFQQEQMLAELKDLVQKGLFTQAETKQILRRRTQFETALVRRVAKKNDYLRYAAYEMQLESLRRKRVERLQVPPGPPTISDYALVRRQFHIFERALKKFKADVGLWVEYIRVAQREGARALVGRITARALQLHPNKPAFYILAAAHELTHLAPSAARALLQRGIRLNGESAAMWREYVRMEMGFVESVRRRWELLGIAVDAKDESTKPDGEGEGRLAALEKMAVDGAEEEAAAVGGEPAGKEAEEGELGEEARRAVMNGAIVKEVISSAVKALPKIELFTELAELIRAYPSPPALRAALLDHLYAHLATALPSSAPAARMHATRALDDAPVGSEAFVDALRAANEALRAKSTQGGAMARMYAGWVEAWCARPIDAHLKLYLTASLAPHAPSAPSAEAAEGKPKAKSAHPALLAAHLRLLTPPRAEGEDGSSASDRDTTRLAPLKLRKLAKRYTGMAPRTAGVWLARLGVEGAVCALAGEGKGREEALGVWKEARGAVGNGDGDGDGDEEGEEEGGRGEREKVWTWGLDRPELGLTEEESVGVLEHPPACACGIIHLIS